MVDIEKYHAPKYRLTVDGRDITPGIDARLINLQLDESRGEQADQLSITLDDSDGHVALPRKGSEVTLKLGWDDRTMVDKGSFVVDEVEHSGAPDQISIRARSAQMRLSLRTRKERSWHDTNLGEIAQTIASEHKLSCKIDPKLAQIKIEHVDQTNESALNLVSRLARRYDAVCSIKKNNLVILPITGHTNASSEPLAAASITRADGDQHRYHSADRQNYSGVRAAWHDAGIAKKQSVLVGNADNAKQVKDSFTCKADAEYTARSEMQRVERGKATLELTLALGRPDLMPQTQVRVSGFKPEINSTNWLVVKCSHTLGDGGLTTRIEMERSIEPVNDSDVREEE